MIVMIMESQLMARENVNISRHLWITEKNAIGRGRHNKTFKFEVEMFHSIFQPNLVKKTSWTLLYPRLYDFQFLIYYQMK